MSTTETNEMIDGLNHYLGQLKIKLIIFKNKLNALELKDSELDTDISTLESRVTTSENNIIAINSEIATLKTRTTAAENNINKLTTDLSALTTRTTAAENNINKLTTDLSALTTRVASAESQITSLNSSLSALTVKVNNHIADINNPHKVNKTQVGLGNVDNFRTATIAETVAGESSQLFVTPKGLSEAIKSSAGGNKILLSEVIQSNVNKKWTFDLKTLIPDHVTYNLLTTKVDVYATCGENQWSNVIGSGFTYNVNEAGILTVEREGICPWVQCGVTNIPSNTFDAITVNCNDEIYSWVYNTLWKFSPLNNLWTNLGNTPVALIDGGAVSYGNLIYFTGSGYLYSYNVLNAIWTRLENCPLNYYSSAYGIIGQEIYVATGRIDTTRYKQCYKYNIVSNTWTRLADYPLAISDSAGFVLGNEFYVCGGHISSSNGVDNSYKYNALTDTWVEITTMPQTRLAHTSAVYKNKAYIYGGRISGHGVNEFTTLVYDPTTSSWLQMSDGLIACYEHSASFAANKMYVFFNGFNSNIYSYQPSNDPVPPFHMFIYYPAKK